MRTTIRLDDHLLAEAKKLAAEKGKRLTAIIEDGLRQALAQRRPSNRRSKVRLTTFGGKGLQRQVDLDDTASLLDRMERLDAAH